MFYSRTREEAFDPGYTSSFDKLGALSIAKNLRVPSLKICEKTCQNMVPNLLYVKKDIHQECESKLFPVENL